MGTCAPACRADAAASDQAPTARGKAVIGQREHLLRAVAQLPLGFGQELHLFGLLELVELRLGARQPDLLPGARHLIDRDEMPLASP